MMPLPFQMIIAALACLRAKANIPIALAACWVSNPFTQIPIWVSQAKLGQWLLENTSIKLPFEEFVMHEVYWMGMHIHPGSFILGFFMMGIFASLLAYPIVYGIYALLPHLHHSKPIKQNRGYCARRDKKDSSKKD